MFPLPYLFFFFALALIPAFVRLGPVLLGDLIDGRKGFTLADLALSGSLA